MKLTAEQSRALKFLLNERGAQDTEDQPIAILQELIRLGLAKVAERFPQKRSGKTYACRVVEITDAGRQALKDSDQC